MACESGTPWTLLLTFVSLSICNIRNWPIFKHLDGEDKMSKDNIL